MHDATRRRVTRLALGLPAVLASWALLVGLPLTPTATGRGHLVARMVKLTGPGATVRPTRDPAAGASRTSKRASKGANRSAASRAAIRGWTAVVPVALGTETIALSWSGAPTGSAQIRSRSGGRWSPWTSDVADPSEGPDQGGNVRAGNGRAGIGPIWLGRSRVDEVEIQVRRGPLTDLAVDAMHWDRATAGGIPTAGAEPAQPAIHLRDEWASTGWRYDNPGCSSGPTVMSSLKFAVIHHTVNSNAYQPDDVPGLMAAVYRYHTDSLGWCDTAYNFIIDRFGRTWQGRSGDITRPVMGGHAKGFNTSSLGVSFLGQYEPGASPTAAFPSQAALDAARDLVAWKFGLHGIDPNATVQVQSQGSTRYPSGVWVTIPTIIGHRDVGLTACPGAYLYSRLADMRAGVAVVLAAGRGPWAPFTSTSALVAQQFRDVMRRDASPAEVAWWASRLEGRTWSIGQLVATMVESGEADRKVDSIVRLYFAFFQRPPDHNGITYWLQRRAEGRTLSSIAEPFASSTEFRNSYGALSNTSYVERVYGNVLGRSPDRAGLAYWTSRLAAGVPRGQMMASFSESTEYVAKSGNRVHLAASFEAILRRAVDPSAFSYYGSRLTDGALLSSITSTLFASTEYQRRF